MKKWLILPLILAVWFALLACAPDTRLSLDAQTPVSTTTEILPAALETMMSGGETFALLISSDLCTGCSEFEPYLDEIIADYQIVVYKVTKEDGFPSTNSVIPYSLTPTFVLVQNGTVLLKFDPSDQEESFDSAADFVEFIDNYVLLQKK